jgi:signal transduction histidine kinase
MEERNSRVRSEARAEFAAHLHDSVLQTLALIQRASEPREMAGLARTQERELRAWLYGRAPTVRGLTLRDAIDDMASRIERDNQVRVEAIVVGDLALDDDLQALVAACTEAAHNAARHAGVDVVSVYVEVEPGQVSAYVRDEGSGFDRRSVPADRRGITDSIERRMERHGGSARVRSEPGRGTEVVLRLPRAPE